MSVSLYQEPARWLADFITDYVERSPGNDLGLTEREKAWGRPLIGFAAGNDPLWRECKRHIGDFFWTPDEVFNLTYPLATAAPEELGVVAWVLPQTAATINENAAQKTYPSRRWAAARASGEDFNLALRKNLAMTLIVQGVQAVAPMVSPLWSVQESPRFGRASNWSERHAAYVAGLGTFGLCDGLITAKGKAMRAGSLVARLPLEPSPRPYQGIHDYCLFYSQGNCGKCIPRCPVRALSAEGHDKKKCYRHVKGSCPEYIAENYGFTTDACGLCQVGVPCMDHIPAKEEGD